MMASLPSFLPSQLGTTSCQPHPTVSSPLSWPHSRLTLMDTGGLLAVRMRLMTSSLGAGGDGIPVDPDDLIPYLGQRQREHARGGWAGSRPAPCHQPHTPLIGCRTPRAGSTSQPVFLPISQMGGPRWRWASERAGSRTGVVRTVPPPHVTSIRGTIRFWNPCKGRPFTQIQTLLPWPLSPWPQAGCHST